MPSCAGLQSASSSRQLARLRGTSGSTPASGGISSDQTGPLHAATAVPVPPGVVRQPLRVLNNPADARPGFSRRERANPPAPAKQVVSHAEL